MKPREEFKYLPEDGYEFLERGPVDVLAYDHKAFSQQFAVETGSESQVQQHLADEVDINTIVRRFGMTREMPSGVAGGVYGDFTGVEDFRSAVETVERARDGFLRLPPDIRERFENDPGKLIDFVQNASEEDFRSVFDPPAPAAPGGDVG